MDEPRVPTSIPRPGATAHFSKNSGRWAVVLDANMTALDVTSALSLYLPGGVRLVESTSNGDMVMLVFQGEPDGATFTASGSG